MMRLAVVLLLLVLIVAALSRLPRSPSCPPTRWLKHQACGFDARGATNVTITHTIFRYADR